MKSKLILLLFFTIIYNMMFAQKNATPYKSGDLRLDIKLPHFNYLYLNPKNDFIDQEFGFNG